MSVVREKSDRPDKIEKIASTKKKPGAKKKKSILSEEDDSPSRVASAPLLSSGVQRELSAGSTGLGAAWNTASAPLSSGVSKVTSLVGKVKSELTHDQWTKAMRRGPASSNLDISEEVEADGEGCDGEHEPETSKGGMFSFIPFTGFMKRAMRKKSSGSHDFFASSAPLSGAVAKEKSIPMTIYKVEGGKEPAAKKLPGMYKSTGEMHEKRQTYQRTDGMFVIFWGGSRNKGWWISTAVGLVGQSVPGVNAFNPLDIREPPCDGWLTVSPQKGGLTKDTLKCVFFKMVENKKKKSRSIPMIVRFKSHSVLHAPESKGFTSMLKKWTPTKRFSSAAPTRSTTSSSATTVSSSSSSESEDSSGDDKPRPKGHKENNHKRHSPHHHKHEKKVSVDSDDHSHHHHHHHRHHHHHHQHKNKRCSEDEAARIIQNSYRKRHHRRQEKSATKIQTAWRGKQAARMAQDHSDTVSVASSRRSGRSGDSRERKKSERKRHHDRHHGHGEAERGRSKPSSISVEDEDVAEPAKSPGKKPKKKKAPTTPTTTSAEKSTPASTSKKQEGASEGRGKHKDDSAEPAKKAPAARSSSSIGARRKTGDVDDGGGVAKTQSYAKARRAQQAHANELEQVGSSTRSGSGSSRGKDSVTETSSSERRSVSKSRPKAKKKHKEDG